MEAARSPEQFTPKSISILLVLLKCLIDVNIWNHISIHKYKIRAHQRLCIDIPEHIPEGSVHVWGDDVHRVGRVGSTPLGLPVRAQQQSYSMSLELRGCMGSAGRPAGWHSLQVFLDFAGHPAAEDECFLHACRGEELQGVVDHRHVPQRQ